MRFFVRTVVRGSLVAGAVLVASACGGETLATPGSAPDAGQDSRVAARDSGAKVDAPKDAALHRVDAVVHVDAPALDAPSPPSFDTGLPDVVTLPEAMPSSDALSPTDALLLPEAGIDAGFMCPPTVPPSHGTCAAAQTTCTYPTNNCSCSIAHQWDCDECPVTQPTEGTMCMAFMGGLSCTYGPLDCKCFGSQQWACATCPASMPATGSACTLFAAVCMYGTDECECLPGSETEMPDAGTTWSCH